MVTPPTRAPSRWRTPKLFLTTFQEKEPPMMLGILEGYDLLIVLGIILLLFGSSQLPKLARSLGSASHEFKKGTEESAAAKATPANPTAPPAATSPPASAEEVSSS